MAIWRRTVTTPPTLPRWSEAERLGSALHLGATAGAHRLQRRAGLRVGLGEQATHRLPVAGTRRCGQGEHAGQALDDLGATALPRDQEVRWDAGHPIGAWQPGQRMVSQQLLNPLCGDAELVGHLREGEQVDALGHDLQPARVVYPLPTGAPTP